MKLCIGKIKDSAEIYKSGVFLKKVRLKNKRKAFRLIK